MYPIMLDIKNKKCTVIGGGKTALRKAKKLYEYGARVTVISPDFCDDFEFAEKIEDKYNVKYIENSFLIITASNDRELNQAAARDAKARGILVSLTDNLEQSDFVSPCSKKTGSITISVSTDGKYPLLAKKLCGIKACDIGFYNDLLSVLEKYRQRILQERGDTKIELLSLPVSDEMIELAKTDMTAFLKYLS